MSGGSDLILRCCVRIKCIFYFMLVFCILFSCVNFRSYSSENEQNGENIPLIEEQKSDANLDETEEQKGVIEEPSFNLADVLGETTQVFKYIDRKQFEENGHVARLEPLEDLNTYVFANADGTNTVYMTAENVKFIKDDGIIVEKDISLFEENGRYKTKENDIQAEFPENCSDGVIIGKDELSLVMKAAGAEAQAEYDEETNYIIYRDVFGEGTAVRYTPTLSGIKEDIILDAYTGQSAFTFEIVTDLELFEDGSGYCFAPAYDSEQRLSLGQIYTYDAEGKFDIGHIGYKKNENGYLLTVYANEGFLTADDTVYPVTVDPTVQINNRDGSGNYLIHDVTIAELYPNVNLKDNIEGVCGNRSYETHGIQRTAIRLVGLEQNSIFGTLNYSDVTSMYLNLRASTNAPSKTILVNKMLGEQTWDRDTVKWNNVGTYDGSSTCTGSLAYWQWSAVDITMIAQMWRAYDYDSLCLLCRVNGDETQDCVSFTSSSHTNPDVRPYLTFTYAAQITFQSSYVEVEEGQNTTVTVTVLPSTAQYSWSLANTSLASMTVSGNTATVTGVRAGTTYVMVSYFDANGTFYSNVCGVIVTIKNGVYDIESAYSTYKMTKALLETGTPDVYQYFEYASSVPEITKLRQKWKIERLYQGYYVVRSMHNPTMVLAQTDGNVQMEYLGETNSNVPNNAKWIIRWDNGYIFDNSSSGSKAMQVIEASTGGNSSVIAGANNINTRDKCKWTLTEITNCPSGIFFYDTVSGMDEDFITIETKYVAPEETRTLADLNIGVIVYSPGTNSQSVTWESVNGAKVTVDSSGNITGVSSGDTTISAKKNIGNLTYSHPYDVSITAIANGTYFLKNKETECYARVLNGIFSDNQNAVQYQLAGGSSQKWTFTHLGDGYYSIKVTSSGTDYYLGALNNSTSLNANMVIHSTFSNHKKWKVTETSDDVYKLTSKTGEANEYVLASSSSSNTGNANLIQCTYTNDSNYRDEWEFVTLDNVDATLIAIPGGPMHPPHDLAFDDIEASLNDMDFNEVDIYYDNVSSPQLSKEDIQKKMMSSGIFVIRCHGERTIIHLEGGTLSVDHIENWDDDALDNAELIIIGGCYTGQGGENESNIVNALCQKGAKTVIGFTVDVQCVEVNDWLKYFFESLETGSTVSAAISYAEEVIHNLIEDEDNEYHTSSTIGNCHVAGDKYNVIFEQEDN